MKVKRERKEGERKGGERKGGEKRRRENGRRERQKKFVCEVDHEIQDIERRIK